MSLKKYIILMLTGTLISVLVFFSVVMFFNPFDSGLMILVFFYLSLGISLVGGFALIGLFIRRSFAHHKMVFRDVITSFRQGVLLSILIILSLILLRIDSFNYWSIFFLILFLSFIELYTLNITNHRSKF